MNTATNMETEGTIHLEVCVENANIDYKMEYRRGSKINTGFYFTNEYDNYVDDEKNGDTLEVIICCLPENDQTNPWTIDTEIDFELTKENGEKVLASCHACFTRSRPSFCFTEFPEIDELVDLDLIETENQIFKIKAQLRVKWTCGLFGNYSAPLNIDSEVCLEVADRKIYVDKYALMSTSSVFREMLSSNSSSHFEINNTDYKTLLAFVRLLNHNHSYMITHENFNHFLKLAETYQIPFLTAQCEDYLVSPECNFCAEGKLSYAERYKLSKFQEHVISNLREDDIRSYIKDTHSSKTVRKDALSRRLCEIEKEEAESKAKRMKV